MPSLTRVYILALVGAVTVASTTVGQQARPAPLPAGTTLRQPLFTYDSVEAAWQEVKRTNRPLLLFVSMKDCHFCDKMERETFGHPELSRSIRSLFITAKMKKDVADPQLIQMLGIRAFPTTLVISPEGDLIARIEGFADPKSFVMTVRPALAKHAKSRGRTAAQARQPQRRGPTRQ